MTELAITADDVRDAARLIEGQVLRTPCTPSKVLSKLTGAEIWLKFENFQFTASFKERGAVNKLARLSEAERRAGVAAMSAGNHAQEHALYQGAQHPRAGRRGDPAWRDPGGFLRFPDARADRGQGNDPGAPL